MTDQSVLSGGVVGALTSQGNVVRIGDVALSLTHLTEEEALSILDAVVPYPTPIVDPNRLSHRTLSDFAEAGILPSERVNTIKDDLTLLQTKLEGGKIARVSYAINRGAGTAEDILNCLGLLESEGISTIWLAPDRCKPFYGVTSGMQEAYQSPDYPHQITPKEMEILHLVSICNFERMRREGCLDDIKVFVADDQQIIGHALLFRALYPKATVIYRAHLDPSAAADHDPNSTTQYIYRMLQGQLTPDEDSLLIQYLQAQGIPNPCAQNFSVHHAIFHTPFMAQVAQKQGLTVPCSTATPSIDPLSNKIRPLPDAFLQATAQKYGLAADETLPHLILQAGRYNVQKGPLEALVASIEAVHQLPFEQQTRARVACVGTLRPDNADSQRIYQTCMDLLKALPREKWPQAWRESNAKDLTNFVQPLNLKNENSGSQAAWLTSEQQAALIEDLRTQAISQKLSGAQAEEFITTHLALYRQDGGAINALEVNALQTMAARHGVVAQFSNYEGYGLTAAEAKAHVHGKDNDQGAYVVLTKVGGLALQSQDAAGNAAACAIDYPQDEITASKAVYARITAGDAIDCLALYDEIARRNSVKDFTRGIVEGLGGGQNVVAIQQAALRSTYQTDISPEGVATWTNTIHNAMDYHASTAQSVLPTRIAARAPLPLRRGSEAVVCVIPPIATLVA